MAMRILTLDVGTTCAKAQVFDDEGGILFYETRECGFKIIENHKYADIIGIVGTVKELIKQAATVEEIDSIAVSSFGESFVALDENDNVLFYPMLYTDVRGEKEANEIVARLGKEKVFAKTGTVPHSMYSISKLLWLKGNEPKIYEKTSKLFLICDYIGYVLTGKRIIDYSLAARTGIFDIKNKVFADDLLKSLGLKENLFSVPKPIGSIVGNLKDTVCAELGVKEACKVILGSHDQVCATIGAGIIASGQSADGMGTVECITAVFDKPTEDFSFGEKGYCVVPFLDNLYCTYMFNYTSNLVVNWFRNNIMHGYSGDFQNQFDYLEQSESPSGVLLLPYLEGSATPYQDGNAKGAFLNLTSKTRDVDLYRAILEGTSYEMKLNLEIAKKYGINVNEIVATGGGANSNLWVQIKSDILDVPIKTLRSSEGGLCGLAMLSAVALGICKDLYTARDVFVQYKNTYLPQMICQSVYEKKYGKYKNLYKALKEFN